MLRSHILHEAYVWILLWLMIALLLLMTEALLRPELVVAIVRQGQELLTTFWLQLGQFV